MNIDSIGLLYFSPTGTTRKIISNIANEINSLPKEKYNLNKSIDDQITINNHQLTIIGVPVYAGRVPITAIERLNKIKGNNTPTIIVAVYGNRAYEDALIELYDTVKQNGFIPIAAATFIGEHSYSCSSHPIAEGRPDENDIVKAKEFGKTISTIIANKKIADLPFLTNLPGNKEYKERKEFPNISPRVLVDRCNKCGKCASICPVSALQFNSAPTFDQEKCLMCCACVKQCPNEAIVFDDPFIMNIKKWLADNFPERKEPEFFYHS